MPRHNKRRIFYNVGPYYEPIRRGQKKIQQYDTPIMRNPTVADRASIITNKHVWKYGDRLYNLSYKYYSDPTFWWIIAWWNGYGIEGDIKPGAILHIPLDISEAIKILGV